MNIDDLKGCFANITDDELLRDNGNLYAENKELKQEIERLNNNWQKLKDEIKESKKICIAHNNDIGISFLDTMLNKIELIEEKNK